MTDVQFTEEAEIVRRSAPVASTGRSGSMAALLIRSGFAKTEQQARVMLVTGAVLILAAATALFLSVGAAPGDRYGNLEQLKAENPEWFPQ